MTANSDELFKKALKSLKLYNHAAQTACFYKHQLQKFPELDTPIMHSACILLAVKQTNISRKQRDIINVYYSLLMGKELQIDNHLFNLKDSLVVGEYLLLRVLGFQTEVPSLYIELTKLLLKVEKMYSIEVFQKIAQCCFGVLNEAIYMDKCVRYMQRDGEIIVLAVLKVSVEICIGTMESLKSVSIDERSISLARDICDLLDLKYQSMNHCNNNND